MTAHSDLRRASRRRVLMRATLITSEGAQPGRIKDLTRSGAGIVCDRPPEPGSDVVLKRGNLFIAARVVWTGRKAAGLEFYREVDPEELTATFVPA